MGRYALGLAWATPLMLAARMQLRYVLAADAERKARFETFAAARAAACGAALVAIAAAAFATQTRATAWTILLVAAIRAVEDAGDLLLGEAQRSGEWPLIARSMLCRGLGGALAVGGMLALAESLPAALAAGLAWQLAVTLWHDWPAVRPRLGGLERPRWAASLAALRAHAPLGAAAALVSFNAYIPRYAVERHLGLEAVGVFTALAQIALAGNMAVQAVGQAAVGPLGLAYAAGRRAFLGKLAGLLVFASLCGCAGMLAAAVFGPRLLALLYRPEFAAYGDELLWMMAAAALTYVTAMLGYALMASGEHRVQLWIFGASSAAALAASSAAMPAWGLRGAAAALVASWVVAAGGAAFGVWRRIGAWRRAGASRKLSGWNSPEAAQRGAMR